MNAVSRGPKNKNFIFGGVRAKAMWELKIKNGRIKAVWKLYI